jgi:Holliday junction resolvase RusA-like endonuclease
MLREITFAIYDKPIPWKRPAHAKNGRNYDAQKKEKLYYRTIICQYLKKYPSMQERLLSGPISINLRFYFKLPTSKQALQNKGLYHIQKPDLDNLTKFVLDVMSGILFEDDASVFKINATKCYSNNQKTEVTVKEVSQEPLFNPTEKERYNGQKNFIPATSIPKKDPIY